MTVSIESANPCRSCRIWLLIKRVRGALTLGKLKVAGKTPPSKGVSSGPCIKHSHSKRLDSSTGPATIPSGDSLSRALYSLRRRLFAAANDILWVGRAATAVSKAQRCNGRRRPIITLDMTKH